MIKSMTGFGRGESSDGIHSFTVEIKTLNHRYNDIVIKMPKHIGYLEERVKKIIKKYIIRGRVEVYINLEYINETNVDINVDIPLAKSYKSALERVAEELNIEEKITLDNIVSIPEIIKIQRKEEDEEVIWNCLKPAVEDAVDYIMNMRIKEGEELKKDVLLKINNFKEIIKSIEKKAPFIVNEYKEGLRKRVSELLGDEFNLDEEKLMNEVVFFADKSNINEEIVRLYSHINQFESSLELNESVGRKLDFLIQEMNREINTIGSKVNDIEVNSCVVEAKSELEKIREQVQNFE
ncbi:YicC family protein [Acidilutibacter cellobiosedens]|uniref:YicC family protein n=2 Tax=Acidilutibacter cellobiosedens TaxID=2507161 RepID=A0A410QH68_9FIRM|nr:YicC family protein [Acidilutibacter cellobiosedens]